MQKRGSNVLVEYIEEGYILLRMLLILPVKNNIRNTVALRQDLNINY